MQPRSDGSNTVCVRVFAGGWLVAGDVHELETNRVRTKKEQSKRPGPHEARDTASACWALDDSVTRDTASPFVESTRVYWLATCMYLVHHA